MRGLIVLSALLASLGLAAGFALRGMWLLAGAALAIELLRLPGWRSRQAWAASATLVVELCLLIAGSLLGLPAALLLSSTLLALAAWDLEQFTLRLSGIAGASSRALSVLHLRRLLVVLALGLSLGGLALSLQLRISFWWALGLAVGALLSLRQLLQASE